jgi:hypothetical protein
MLTDVSMRSLFQKLDEKSIPIQHIAPIWSIDLTEQDASALVSLLRERMQDPLAARSVWERLSPAERLCLFQTFGSGNPTQSKAITRERLRKKTKLSAEALEEAIHNLKYRWYLVDEETLPRPPSALRRVEDHELPQELAVFPYRECFASLWQSGQELFKASADRTMYPLEHFLRIMPGDQLQKLAHLCHVQIYTNVPVYSYNALPSMSHPLEVQKRVYEAMQHPLLPFEILHHLDPLVQRVFLWLCEREEGKANMNEVRAYLASPQWTEANLLAMVQELSAHALAFDSLSREGERWLFVPHDLLDVVKREAHECTLDEQRYVLAPLPSDQTDLTVQHEGQPLVLYDLATIIGLMFQNTIEPIKDGRVPKRLQSKWRSLLHGRARMSAEQEDLYLDQIFSAAKEMELLSTRAPAGEEKQRYVPGPRLKQWIESTEAEQARWLVQWWIESSTFRDVLPDGKLISSPTSRKTLLEHLGRCVAGYWYSVEALLHALWRQAPLYLYDPYQRKLSKPTSLRSLREQWMQREGMVYTGLLEALTEFGVLSLGVSVKEALSENKRPDLFCVTTFGAAFFASPARSEPQEMPPEDQATLIVQPNFDLLLLQFQSRVVFRFFAI